MTETELKAKAYELILIMDNCKMQLMQINDKLAKLAAEKKDESVQQ